MRRQDGWTELLTPAGPGPFDGGCFLMAPWVNRIYDARLEWEGRQFPLASNLDDGSAIHGDVAGRAWDITAQGPTFVHARWAGSGENGFNFPFPLLFNLTLILHGSRVLAKVAIRNTGEHPAPVGAGWHPWFRRTIEGAGDVIELSVGGTHVYPCDGARPTGPAVPRAGALAWDGFLPLENRFLDHAFTLAPREKAAVRWPRSGVSVSIEASETMDHLFVYAPREHAGRTADFVCVEPMSHAVDGARALARGWPGTGVHRLEPGGDWSAETVFLVSRLLG